MIKIISRILVRIESRYCKFCAERFYSKFSDLGKKHKSTTNKKTKNNG